jgi:hypothetical protein
MDGQAKNNNKNLELESGWTFDQLKGVTSHFEHFVLSEAGKLQEIADMVHVVETINGTLAAPDLVHKNKYFAENLNDAIGLAARIVIDSLEVAETVTAIRPATDEEISLFESVDFYFYNPESESLSEQEVKKICKQYKNDAI